MSARSLSCSPEGIQKAKRALIRYSLTQKALAEELEVTRQPIGKFFTGKPVDRNLFVQICDRLDLEWEEIIAELVSEPEVNQDNSIDIAAIVQAVREKIKPLIQERCGTMRVLDMTQPIGLNDIYTSVNILEKLTGQQRLGINQLFQECTNEDFDRFRLSIIAEKRVPGLEAVEKYSKLMILGKPGAGKTTFLKYLAIQCLGGEFQADYVPIFITLKDFAETANKPGLLQYIIEDARNPISSIENVINYDKALVLLDGLDEVREEDSDRILKEIREFSDRFSNNHFVITCRIAAKEYTFEKFTEVEVADFDDEQIANFAKKWFTDKAVQPETFIKRLEDNSCIKELAASPLLLTLLCLAFEESGDFPANRSELYKEGLDALLKKWDAKRGIQRYQIYKKLSIQRKEDLLSKMALTTFDGSEYFFKQKAAEQYITEYIRNLPDANTDEEALQLDSEKVLRSIEHHHGLVVARAKGIYSFSHLTFHEYFTAREFVVVRQSSQEALQNLVSHITEKRWREVFLLAVGMSPSADRLLLLMKEKIDVSVAADQRLQQFLMWVTEKSLSVEVSCKPAAVRAFYLNIDLEIDPDRPLGCAIDQPGTCVLACASLLSRAHNQPNLTTDTIIIAQNIVDLNNKFNNKYYCDFKSAFAIALARDNAIVHIINDPKIDSQKRKELQQIKENLLQIPVLYNNEDESRNWLKDWIGNKRQTRLGSITSQLVLEHKFGSHWQFSDEQNKLIKQYYNANILLVECLNSDCYVSREVRQQIEDTLLLPIAEIKQRQQQS
ncbi:MAG: NACHT domain-containing NTPase [Nostoc sp.]|uniref:NACHT domain-containing NTPase n=1 Tax=Nostoc sp. TaxID=1180 RepID=UPI002FF98E85